MALDLEKSKYVVVKEEIPEITFSSSAEEQLIYNIAVQSQLGNVRSFYATEEKDMVILRVEYDDWGNVKIVEVGIKDKELFFRFFMVI